MVSFYLQAIDFLDKLLRYDHQDRLTAREAMVIPILNLSLGLNKQAVVLWNLLFRNIGRLSELLIWYFAIHAGSSVLPPGTCSRAQ